MYCSGCGSALPNEVLFCPHCGKRCCVLDEPANDPPPSDTPPATEKVADHSLESGSLTSGSPAAPVTVEPRSRLRHGNGGSITLGVFGLTCFIIGAVQGFIPIFLIAGLAFVGLAWLCALKWPLSEGLLSVVLVSSLLVAGLVGVALDQDSFGPRYRYLSQGSTQIRVDEKAGRTDRLGSNGWYPVAFNKEAQEVPDLISLTKGRWTSTLGGEICFTVSNPASSGYIVDRVAIQVQTQTSNTAAKGTDLDSIIYGTNYNVVVLKSYGGGLISPGQDALACGPSPRDLLANETWTVAHKHIYGWKR
jgi:hypothetical protein